MKNRHPLILLRYQFIEEGKRTMEQTVHQENKMGIFPIPKLLFGMSLPMMLSMLVQALYNIVDSIFVAQINEDALTAVSLVFPVQTLMIAVATSTGVGINALLSKNLGEKDFDGANNAARNGLFLAVISYIIVGILGFSLANTFMSVQTQIPAIVDYGTIYMRVVIGLCFGCYLSITFERLLQSTGRTIFTMIMQLVGAAINIVMDPILIFGLFGFPKMGVAGAGIATVAGQIIAMFLGLIFNLTLNDEISINFRGFRPNLQTIKRIYIVGIPSFIMQAIGSVMTFFFNKILLMFTSTAAAVFGVYFKLQSFIFMPIFGLNNGMVPIIAYNYGARKKERIIQTARLSIVTAVCLMLLGLAIFMIFPGALLKMFNASEEMLNIGIPALRAISLSFTFAGYCIITGSVFQALGNGVYSMIVSMIRQLFVLLPAAFILARFIGLNAVWWSFPIAEIASVIVTTILLKRIYKEKLQNL